MVQVRRRPALSFCKAIFYRVELIENSVLYGEDYRMSPMTVFMGLVQVAGFEPARISPKVFETFVSACFTTPAYMCFVISENRLCHIRRLNDTMKDVFLTTLFLQRGSSLQDIRKLRCFFRGRGNNGQTCGRFLPFRCLLFLFWAECPPRP